MECQITIQSQPQHDGNVRLVPNATTHLNMRDVENTPLLPESQTGEANSTDTTPISTSTKICLLLFNVFLICLWGYGFVVSYTSKSTDKICEEEKMWIYVASIVGFLSFCPLLTVAAVPKLRICAECIYGLMIMFFFCWFVYGAVIFFQTSTNACPPHVHYFGYSLIVGFLSVTSLSCCCFMWWYNSIE